MVRQRFQNGKSHKRISHATKPSANGRLHPRSRPKDGLTETVRDGLPPKRKPSAGKVRAPRLTEAQLREWDVAIRQKMTNDEIIAEYKAAGLNVRRQVPGSGGWIECEGFRPSGNADEDKRSAAFNVSLDPFMRGRYRDLGDADDTWSFWDAMCQMTGRWNRYFDVMTHFADKYDAPRPGTDRGTQKLLSRVGQTAAPKTTPAAAPPAQAPAERPAWKNIHWLPVLERDMARYGERKGGISAEAILAAWGRQATYVNQQPVIGFPLYGPDGKTWVGTVLVPEKATHLLIGGKKLKVYTVRGSKSGLMNPFALDRLPGAVVVWIVEGVTDLLALQTVLLKTELRETHVVLAHSCGGGAGSLPEYAELFQGKTVHLVPDADDAGEKVVRKWVKALCGKAKEVRVVRLPYDPGTKKDVRDYLLIDGHPYDDLLALAEAAPAEAADAGEEPDAGEVSAVPPADAGDDDDDEMRPFNDPGLLAERILSEAEEKGRPVRRYDEGYWRYDGLHWALTAEEHVQAQTWSVAEKACEEERERLLEEEGDWRGARRIRVTRSLVQDVRGALDSRILLPEHLSPPCWLSVRVNGRGVPLDKLYPPAETLHCLNGLVHLPRAAALLRGEAVEDVRMDSAPEFFSTSTLGAAFRPDAPPPARWLKFLHDSFGDPELIALLLTWLGYCLTPDTSQQKMLVLLGPRRSGKGVFIRVQSHLLGLVAAPSLSGLASSSFSLEPLLGRHLAAISDARLGRNADTGNLLEVLLRVVGEDRIDVNRKNEKHVAAAKLTTRFVMACNELPKLPDNSKALAGRMLIVPTTRTWYGAEDTRLTEALTAEAPGILNLAILAWDRLQRDGRFKEPEVSRRLREEYEVRSGPVQEFVAKRCKVGPAEKVKASVLFEHYRTWAEMNNVHDATMHDPGAFGRALHEVLPKVRNAQQRHGGERGYYYEGVTVKI